MQKITIDRIKEMPFRLQEKFYERLRDRAILRTKARLIESNVDIKKLSDEELEIIIQDEEDRLLSEYKNRGLVALLALLGLSIF